MASDLDWPRGQYNNIVMAHLDSVEAFEEVDEINQLLGQSGMIWWVLDKR